MKAISCVKGLRLSIPILIANWLIIDVSCLTLLQSSLSFGVNYKAKKKCASFLNGYFQMKSSSTSATGIGELLLVSLAWDSLSVGFSRSD